jgi:predicted dienelactone hydrolase
MVFTPSAIPASPRRQSSVQIVAPPLRKSQDEGRGRRANSAHADRRSEPRHGLRSDRTSAWLHDGRIKAAVIAAPALGPSFTPVGLANVTVPIQLWRAANDHVLPHPYHVQTVYDALPKKPEYHVVPKADHFSFLAPCSDSLARMAPAICQDEPGFDRAAFHEQFNDAVVAFFKARLPAG